MSDPESASDPGADAAGTVHPPADAAARIVSLVPSITELLFALGLGEQVVGRTSFCVHPRPAISAVPRIGGTKTVHLERLRRLAPSHVIVNVDENTREDAEAIAGFVPHVVVTHPLDPRDNPALYRLLGAIFRREAQAEALAARFDRALAALRRDCAGLPPRRVLYLIWYDPWMTVSRSTYISRTLGLVGWETVGHDDRVRYPEIVPDAALMAETDMVLFSSEPFPFKQRHVGVFRTEVDTGYRPLLFIDAEMTSWYGNRAIEGLNYLREFARGLETEFQSP